MELRRAFAMATYLALGLSTACLGYSERLYLPVVVALYPAFLVLLAIAYYVRGRWELPPWSANWVVAPAILVIWVLWVIVAARDELAAGASDLDVIRVIWPRTGPFLTALLLVLVYRRKLALHYWLLHALAFVQIVVACVLDRGAVFGLLLLGYTVCATWSVTLFALYRPELDCASAAVQWRQDDKLRWWGAGIRQALGLFAFGLLFGLVLFFVIPRPFQSSPAALVLPGPVRAEVGFSPIMDLNGNTPVEYNEEIVMRVEARSAAGEPMYLGSNQRWRGVTCALYENGRWLPPTLIDHQDVSLTHLELPGPGQVHLTFHLDLSKVATDQRRILRDSTGEVVMPSMQFPALFLAEPIHAPGGIPRVALRQGGPFRPALSYSSQESVLTIGRNRGAVIYEQILVPRAPSDRRPAELRESYRSALVRVPEQARAIADYAQRVLEEAGLRQAPAEKKARALERHLSESPHFHYSLERRRSDRTLDPTVDFLLNVKEGHCELYASALTLMLRSQNIPARIVIGFKGCDWNSMGGLHEVRQYHAHAWVEAFIENPIATHLIKLRQSSQTGQDRPGAGFVAGEWITLDPTPGGGTASTVSRTRRWWDDTREFALYLWEFFILDFSGEVQQERLVSYLANITWNADWSSIGRSFGIVVLAVVAATAGAVAWRLWQHRSRRHKAASAAYLLRRPETLFYAQMLDLLARRGWLLHLGQTGWEFARQVARTMADEPVLARCAAIPLELTDYFYRVRFGGIALPAADRERIAEQLRQLSTALAPANRRSRL